MEDTRKRVDEIAQANETWRQEADDWRKKNDHRWRKVTIWLTVAFVAVAISSAVSYALIQGQRWQQLKDGCDRTNKQAEASVGLLEDLHVRPPVVLIAKVRYPHIPPLAHREGEAIVTGPPPDYPGPLTCEEFANERVSGPRL